MKPLVHRQNQYYYEKEIEIEMIDEHDEILTRFESQ